MVTRLEIGIRPGFVDSLGESVAKKIRDYLHVPVGRVRTRDVFHVEPALPAADALRVADEFAGPVVRVGAVERLVDEPCDVVVSVGYRPGVTDPVGKSARVAIEDLLGRPLAASGGAGAVYASRLYLLCGVSLEEGQRIARELLANEVIERTSVQHYRDWLAAPPDLTVPHVVEAPPHAVEAIDLEVSDERLAAISRERLLALSLDEMRTIRDFYREAGRDPRRLSLRLPPQPTDVELECLAQTWSEHCKHKIFAAEIEYEGDRAPETIRSLFKTCIRGATGTIDAELRARHGKSWLVSVFVDNAGVIAATERHHLVYKVETHNSPSALDPYGGAITGIVGVNRASCRRGCCTRAGSATACTTA
ncbi:MAG: hypothetical protein MUF27_10585 [Acidobacteria bacterium]|nr:hypothetical protein [Acidobacteriota bacterium]